MARYAAKNGFPEGELRDAINNHPGFRFGIGQLPEITGIEDGETRSVGDYRFQCIHTPGHTPGHICLYEPDRKVLLAGDHILIDITPNIQCWSDEGDPLNRYIESLDRVYTLDVERVLPGHRRLFPTFRERIDGLKTHHQQRADEILEVLDGKTKTGYEVASMMTWGHRVQPVERLSRRAKMVRYRGSHRASALPGNFRKRGAKTERRRFFVYARVEGKNRLDR